MVLLPEAGLTKPTPDKNAPPITLRAQESQAAQQGKREYDVGLPPATSDMAVVVTLGVAPQGPGGAPSFIQPERVAVFVAHGMGQQIPFQTLDAIATRLRQYDEEQLIGDAGVNVRSANGVSRAVKSEEQWLQRIELVLGQKKTPVHVFEAYWAPLTEGQINVKQVIEFLAGAGMNGLKHFNGKFRRWLFDRYEPFAVPVRTVLFLLVALATMVSLVVMNSAIAVVAASRALLSSKADWLTDSLFEDLTTTFDAVITAMTMFAVFLLAAKWTRRWTPRPLRWLRASLSIVSFVVAISVVVISGLVIPFLFYGHVRGAPAAGRFWYKFVSESVVTTFSNGFDTVTWWVLSLAGVVIVLLWIERVGAAFLHDMANGRSKAITFSSTLFVASLAVALGWVTYKFNALFVAASGGGLAGSFRHSLAWPLLVAASAFIRLVLVQFVGDVAIYVMPYKLDAFNDLRKEIKDLVYKAAHAVYALRSDPSAPLEYSRIIIVGHSLGSVIVYDALNKLILEDHAATESLDVSGRTPLFLTFGSPLDKTAYLFAVQGHGTSEARESVAAAVQPMIQSYDGRPTRWVNVFSRWDFISGNLKFYDHPQATSEAEGNALLKRNPKRVENKADPDATTLLMAHTEYWDNEAVVREIYEAATGV